VATICAAFESNFSLRAGVLPEDQVKILRKLGASVMLIGEKLPRDAENLLFQLPVSPPHWQFVVDVLPIQLAAECLSRLAGVDCDSLRICTHVVEDEHGLQGKRAEATPNGE
jgi:hypothetical protein